jgi:hypothetical protein
MFRQAPGGIPWGKPAHFKEPFLHNSILRMDT